MPSCGQSGHYRPECTVVPAEHRQVQTETGSASEGSPERGSPPSGKPKGKAKVQAQAKGVVEEASAVPDTPRANSVSVASAGTGAGSSQETLLAEAAKLLKNVTLKAVRIEGEDSDGALDLGIDSSWLLSAIMAPSDLGFALVDSGATNALRPAGPGELDMGRLIKVDLASGVAELRINNGGTLLHAGPCQVIIPAGYLIGLGCSITSKKWGCRIKHPTRGALEVSVVKGCPLVSREVGLEILAECESWGQWLTAKSVEVLEPSCVLKQSEARGWLRDRLLQVGESGLGTRDQLTFLAGLFPGVPLDLLRDVCSVEWGALALVQ